MLYWTLALVGNGKSWVWPHLASQEGVDAEGLKKYRRKLYRFKDYELTNKEIREAHHLENIFLNGGFKEK